MRKLLLCLLVMPCMAANAQVITTLAGNGVATYTGDGGAATTASLNEPHAVAAGPGGEVYITDYGNNRVRMVSATGIITTVAGNGTVGFSGDGGPATAARLNAPFASRLDNAGNILITDTYNRRIRKVNTMGVISTIAGTGAAVVSGDGGPATAAGLNTPAGLVIDGANNIYYSDQFSHVVRRIDGATGIITTVAGTGVAGYNGDGIAATAAKLNYPNFLALDAAGNLYIADNTAHRIRKVNTAGIISTVAGNGSLGSGGDGGPATAAQLEYPAGISFDAAGDMYIAANLNYKVRKVNAATGVISAVVGTGTGGYSGDGGPATAAMIGTVTDVTFTATGDMVIADKTNQRVRIIASPNANPYFTHGASYALNMCADNVASLDAALEVMDADAGQTLSWSLFSAPANGVAAVVYSTASTGAAIIPSGLSYTPNATFSGTDVFQVMVSDGIASDIITINVTVGAVPDSGVISGADSVCIGSTVLLSQTVSGGVWSISNTSLATISAGGMLTGVAAGYPIVTYTVTNSCGSVTATYFVHVKNCPTHLAYAFSSAPGASVYPNPSKGVFTINTAELGSDLHLSVTNSIGAIILAKPLTAAEAEVDITNQPPGIYVLHIKSSKGTFTHKLVRE